MFFTKFKNNFHMNSLNGESIPAHGITETEKTYA